MAVDDPVMILFLHVSPLEGKDVRQQPAQQFGLELHGLPHGRSFKMEETAAFCATARHLQDWLSIHSVIQFVMGHLHRQDLHDRR